MSREICPDCVNVPCQCFENELKKLSDDMTLSADPLGRIKDLQSRLTAAEARIKELEKDRERLDKFNFLAIEHVVKFTRFENGILDLALAKECGEILAYHGKGSIREAIDLIDCDKLRP